MVAEGRWFERADGIIFRMDDPDHIRRMLSEGWREVNAPVPAEPSPPAETPAEIQARNDAARAAFSGVAPTTTAGKAKRIRPAGERSV